MSVDSSNLPGSPSQNIMGFVRKLIPFGHHPWRNGQKDGAGQQLVCTFTVPDTDTPFVHALGSVPGQYHIVRKSTCGDIYDGSNLGSDWTTVLIVLRCTFPGTYQVWIAP